MEATPTPTTITPPGALYPQQPPPMMVMNQQQAHTPTGSHGSVGAVIGVVAAIAVLGIIAGMIGRLCSGRAIMGYGGHYDVESWLETKCSSCVDGNVGPPPPRVMVGPPVWDTGGEGGASGAGNGTTEAHFPPVGVPMATPSREIKPEVAAAAEREEQQEEERETSDEEQLRHRSRHHRRHSHRQGEEEEQQHEHPHEFHGNHVHHHHHRHHNDIRTAPS